MLKPKLNSVSFHSKLIYHKYRYYIMNIYFLRRFFSVAYIYKDFGHDGVPIRNNIYFLILFINNYLIRLYCFLEDPGVYRDDPTSGFPFKFSSALGNYVSIANLSFCLDQCKNNSSKWIISIGYSVLYGTGLFVFWSR